MLSPVASANELFKKHQLGLRIGMWNQVADTRTEIGYGSVSTSVEGTGPTASIYYNYYIQENIALHLKMGALAASVETDVNSTVDTKTAIISQIMFGGQYYFLEPNSDSAAKPYINLSAGPFIGNQTKTSSGKTVVVESRTESSIALQLSIGCDFTISEYFYLGASLGYNLMSDFSEPIGGSDNYSGPVFGLDLGFTF
jgi:outer membrane protein W